MPLSFLKKIFQRKRSLFFKKEIILSPKEARSVLSSERVGCELMKCSIYDALGSMYEFEVALNNNLYKALIQVFRDEVKNNFENYPKCLRLSVSPVEKTSLLFVYKQDSGIVFLTPFQSEIILCLLGIDLLVIDTPRYKNKKRVCLIVSDNSLTLPVGDTDEH